MIKFPDLPGGGSPIWDGGCFDVSGQPARVLAYSSNFDGWNEDLTELHEIEAGDGAHPIDIASRGNVLAMLQRYGFPADGDLLEIGCSSGFMLRDLQRAYPKASIVGSDILKASLERLGTHLPGIPLLQMDVVNCPLPDRQFDAVVGLNVLEHIEDDAAALRQLARLLKPGGIAILEVPQGPNLYDYFDKYLMHFRRYSHGEFAMKIRNAGLELERSDSLGFAVYPAFFLVKKLNRLRYGAQGERAGDLQKMVRGQISATSRSVVLEWAFHLDRLINRWFRLPLGIRCIAVARKPRAI